LQAAETKLGIVASPGAESGHISLQNTAAQKCVKDVNTFVI
jgi:hypothetical protein